MNFEQQNREFGNLSPHKPQQENCLLLLAAKAWDSPRLSVFLSMVLNPKYSTFE